MGQDNLPELFSLLRELEGLPALALAFPGKAIIPFLKFRSTLDFRCSMLRIAATKVVCGMLQF